MPAAAAYVTLPNVVGTTDEVPKFDALPSSGKYNKGGKIALFVQTLPTDQKGNK